jgi:thiol-disulfide isomerase/thioredoxin
MATRQQLSYVFLILALPSAPLRAADADSPAALTVHLDLVVEDARGRPSLNLRSDEVVVVQDGVRQTVADLVGRDKPGTYELTYVPQSGKAGAVNVQLMRPGTRARGLDGPALKPRVVNPPSALEAELADVLTARPDVNDFAFETAALRYELAADGVHHALAVEVPITELGATTEKDQALAHLQMFARLKDGQGRLLHRFHLDRVVSGTSATQILTQRVVWTAQVHLMPGPYTLEVLVREPASQRLSARRLSFVSPEIPAGLRVSSVALLQPTGALGIQDQIREGDDPFAFANDTLMPTLSVKAVPATGARLRFFTVVYADAASGEPVSLRAELLRSGDIVGSAPLALPQSEAGAPIRYAGALPIGANFPAGSYTLRLRAQQGTQVSFEEAPFEVITEAPSALAPVRIGSATGPSPSPSRAAASSADSPDLAEARRFMKRRQTDEAIHRLKTVVDGPEGQRADVWLLLGAAYFRLGADKDAEAAARRAVVLAKDPPMLAEAYTLLGSVLANSEKKPVARDSEKLRGAEEAYRKVVEVSGGRAENGHLSLAETLYRLDRAEDARAALKTVLGLDTISATGSNRAHQLLDSPRCATEACLPRLSFVQDGRLTSAAELRGKVVVLSFWATWCGPCREAVPELKRIHARYEKDPVVMLGVNLDQDRATMQAFLEKNGIVWPQVTEESEGVSDALSVRGIPAEFVFDHEGVFVARTVGWGTSTGGQLSAYIGQAVGKAKKALKPAVPTS